MPQIPGINISDPRYGRITPTPTRGQFINQADSAYRSGNVVFAKQLLNAAKLAPAPTVVTRTSLIHDANRVYQQGNVKFAKQLLNAAKLFPASSPPIQAPKPTIQTPVMQLKQMVTQLKQASNIMPRTPFLPRVAPTGISPTVSSGPTGITTPKITSAGITTGISTSFRGLSGTRRPGYLQGC